MQQTDRYTVHAADRPIYCTCSRPIDIHFWSHLAQFFSEWEMFQRKVVQKIKTHILRSVTHFFENRALYEIMWKNVVELERPQITIWRMRIACWVTNAQYLVSSTDHKAVQIIKQYRSWSSADHKAVQIIKQYRSWSSADHKAVQIMKQCRL